MVTVTTEIRGKQTSVETYARGSVVEGIHTHLAFEGAILREDPFQDYPAGYIALKHDGWRKVDALCIGQLVSSEGESLFQTDTHAHQLE